MTHCIACILGCIVRQFDPWLSNVGNNVDELAIEYKTKFGELLYCVFYDIENQILEF